MRSLVISVSIATHVHDIAPLAHSGSHEDLSEFHRFKQSPVPESVDLISTRM